MDSVDTIFAPIPSHEEATTYPLSFFTSVKDVVGSSHYSSWHGFVTALQDAARTPQEAKEAALLFCSTVFNGTRSKAHATTSGLIVVDVDHDGNFDEVASLLVSLGVEAIMYTTASHKKDAHRFRVVVPLTALVSPSDYTETVRAVARAIIVKADKTKIGCESLFYMPGRYSCAEENRFDHFRGEIRSAAEWQKAYPAPVPDPTIAMKPQVVDVGDVGTLYDSPFVRSEWITEYLGLPKGEHHAGIFSFMIKVAMRAIALGQFLDPSDLASLASDLDLADGGYYQEGRHRHDFLAEARRATGFAIAHATPPSTATNRTKSFGKVEEAYALFDALTAPTLAEKESRSANSNDLPNWKRKEGITDYRLHDQAYMRKAERDAIDYEFEFLALRCVATKGGYLVRSPRGTWIEHTKKEVVQAALKNEWGGRHDKIVITSESIKRFLSPTGGIVKVEGDLLVPFYGPLVTYCGRRFANSWRDCRINAAEDHVMEAEPILRLIRENLCDLPTASMEAMLSEVEAPESTLFKWVMHWLAAVYQRPGWHIGTALWLVGPTKGFGKSTLVNIMKSLYRFEWCEKASSTEIERGWNSFMNNALLIEADEFHNSTRKDLNRVFKEWIGNRFISVSLRNIGAIKIPAVANWIMTTNDMSPMVVEADDRRHTFVLTTNDDSRKRLPVEINRWSPSQSDRALSGFAAFLSAINIDEPFIMKPFMTELKSDMINTNQSAALKWFAATDRQWRRGRDFEKQADRLYESFTQWFHRADPYASVPTATAFGRQLQELLASGIIRKRTLTGRKFYEKCRYFYEDTGIYFDDKDAFGDQPLDELGASELFLSA